MEIRGGLRGQLHRNVRLILQRAHVDAFARRIHQPVEIHDVPKAQLSDGLGSRGGGEADFAQGHWAASTIGSQSTVSRR